ncbi:MAG: SRPBCC domain-containing protein [Bacteroidota bacterium]
MDYHKEVGLTKDSGWQMGVRKTMDKEFDKVWDFMFSDEGLKIWLGNVKTSQLKLGKEINFDNGVFGKIVVFKAFSHIRMKWKKSDWKNTSRLQLRIMRSKQKTVISFAQEMMLNKAQREEMIFHWKKVMTELSKALT